MSILEECILGGCGHEENTDCLEMVSLMETYVSAGIIDR
jgi:hypothetical protein